MMAAVFFGAFISRQVLMPRLNMHRDGDLQGSSEAKKKFTFLHRCSDVINVAQILVCLIVLIRLSMT